MTPGPLEATGPRGVAVNTSGIGAPVGTTYVVDAASNGTGRRVQRFGPTGGWERLWGQDVIASSVDEQQRLTIDASGGSFTLSFKGDTTDPIAIEGLAGGSQNFTIDDALDALPSIGGDANVAVSGNANDGLLFFITFTGALAAADHPQLSVDSSQLVGTAEVVTLADGTAATADTGTGFEICTVRTECQAGSASGTTANGGQLNNPQGVAVNQANGHVYVTEQNNRRVSEFDADGNFVRAWGWDVVVSGGTGNVSANDFEICTVAAECKQAASNGDDGGRFHSQIGHPVTDGSNHVWIPDAANERIQRFDSEGNFVAAYGWNVDALGGGGELEECTSTALNACQAATNGTDLGKFSSNFPQRLALDSSGNVYANDGGSNDRIQKFDSAFTAAADFAPAVFDLYTTEEEPKNVVATQGGSHLAFSVNNDVNAGGERQIVEIRVSDEAVVDESLVGAGILRNIDGLGSDGADEIYATVSFGFVGGVRNSGPRQVLVLGDTLPPAPALSLKPVGTKTDTTATFEATVDPNGGLITCTFQYSTDQSDWTDVPDPACDELENVGVQALEQGAIGLTPNTQYFLRLKVSRPFVSAEEPGSTVTTPVKTFATDSVPPVVSDVGAVQVTDRAARLVGTIDPRNSETAYVFEYGTTTALGSSTPPVAIGGGVTPTTVSRVVEGLSSDQTYFFVLRATNEFGPTVSDAGSFHTRLEPLPPASPGNCANEQRRVEQAVTHLPDCRAYEMVSPVDKNNGAVTDAIAFARDGEAVVFCPPSLFGDPPAPMTFTCGQYLSERGPDGWKISSPFPPFCFPDLDEVQFGRLHAYFSPASFDRVAFDRAEFESCSVPRLDPAAPAGINIYRGDLAADPFGFDLLTPALGIVDEPGRNIKAGQFAAGSDDFSHVVYMSRGRQTPDTPSAGANRLYDWEEEGSPGCVQSGGCLSLLSVDQSGDPFEGNSLMPAYGTGGSNTPIASSVSADGELIYFQSQVSGTTDFSAGLCNDATCDLYLREGGAETLHVSASECTEACGADESPALFRWANPAGDKTLFVSCAKLTDASAEPKSCEVQLSSPVAGDQLKLYRWDRGAPAGSRLVDLTGDDEPADGTQPRAVDLIGASDDGDVVYFVAGGQIVSGAPLDPGLKLYRWSWNGGSPSVEYLAPYRSVRVDGSDQSTDGHVIDDPNANRRHVRVTPDGQYLLIQTKLTLDAPADRDADADLYRWDEDGGWLCVSCQLPGAPSAGHVSAVEPHPSFNLLFQELVSQEPEHTISDNGKRVFFSTPDALVPEDVNGEAGCPDSNFGGGRVYACQDVYEWHDGRVSLVTSGTGSEPFLLVGATKSADDVFIATEQRLVGWDVDDAMDIYDVRVNGGFEEPPPVPAACEGDGCRGPGSVAPATLGAGSSVLEHPGNELSRANCQAAAKSAKRLSNRARRGRRNARRLASNGKRGRARALHRRAGRLSKRAKRRSQSAKRCRRAVRRAGR